MFLFIQAVAAAEVAVGLALIIKVYQQFQTLDTDGLNRLKG
jgi:NADH-quinone oxidoreductase subunit K